MSAFLGQIHFWLYRKIRLLLAREALLVKRSTDTFGELAEELYISACDMYGSPLSSDRPLEAIIDHQNIHGWLQSQIAHAEIREATFIKDLIDCLGADAVALINDTFYIHGLACGKEAQDQLLSEVTPEEVYKAMQDFYVNGMPCDGSDAVLVCTTTAFSWENTHINQRASWNKSGVSPSVMMVAYRRWFEGFADGIHRNINFSVNTNELEPVYTLSLSVLS